MKKYLRMAREASRKKCSAGVIACVMDSAIVNGCLDEAHDIGIEFGSRVSDALVQKLAMASLAAAKARATACK